MPFSLDYFKELEERDKKAKQVNPSPYGGTNKIGGSLPSTALSAEERKKKLDREGFDLMDAAGGLAWGLGSSLSFGFVTPETMGWEDDEELWGDIGSEGRIGYMLGETIGLFAPFGWFNTIGKVGMYGVSRMAAGGGRKLLKEGLEKVTKEGLEEGLDAKLVDRAVDEIKEYLEN